MLPVVVSSLVAAPQLVAGAVVAAPPAAAGRPPLPSFTSSSVFAAAEPTWLWLPLAAMVGVYLLGVYRMRARGDRWPVGRTVLFCVGGVGTLALALVSGLATYDDTLLSVHMVQHMLLSMIAPIFLALGAPVTLALRTLPARQRHRLVAVLHSRYARIVTFPLVAYVVFVASPFALYFSGLYRLSLTHPVVHDLVHLHFLVSGCVYFFPLIGLDPVPNRWPYPLRALMVFLSTPFHAVLGLTIMQSTELLAGGYSPSLGLRWLDPAADQRLAGGILWAAGEFVSILLLGALVAQWMRQSEREGRQVDRRLDRDERAALQRAPATEAPAAGAAAAPAGPPAVGRPQGRLPVWWETGGGADAAPPRASR